MLNAEDESLNEGLKVKDPIFAMAATFNSKPNNSGYNQSYNRGRGRGNYSNNRGGRGGRDSSGGQSTQFNQFSQFPHNQFNTTGTRSERPTCQICGNLEHLAIDCYHRMNYTYQGKHPPTKLVAMAIASNACLTRE